MGKVIAINGLCSTKASSVGYQFVFEGQKLYARTAFKVFGTSTGGGATDVTGEFYTSPTFKCTCGNKHLYQCCVCKKYVCYDGVERRNVKCPACGAVNDLPTASPDGRIACSYKADAGKADIVLAIDVSSSMEGTRLNTVKREAVKEFVSRYVGKSRMALMTFASTSVVLSSLTSDLSYISSKISSLTAYGGTTPPLNAVLNDPAMSEFRNSENNRYLVIFTDGEWYGDENEIIANAEKIKRMGIKILTIGCAGANAGFLKRISSPDGSIITTDSGIGKAFAAMATKSGQ